MGSPNINHEGSRIVKNMKTKHFVMNVWELLPGREPTMIYVNYLPLFVIQNNFSKNAPSPLVLDHAGSNPVIGIGLRIMRTFWELTKSMVS